DRLEILSAHRTENRSMAEHGTRLQTTAADPLDNRVEKPTMRVEMLSKVQVDRSPMPRGRGEEDIEITIRVFRDSRGATNGISLCYGPIDVGLQPVKILSGMRYHEGHKLQFNPVRPIRAQFRQCLNAIETGIFIDIHVASN